MKKDAPALLFCFVAWAAAWTLLFISTAKSAEPDPWPAFKSICQLDHEQDRRTWSGSGTLVARHGNVGLILSCRHVNATVGHDVKVSFLNAGFWSNGVVVYVHEGSSFENDLALIIAPVPSFMAPIEVVDFDPDNGPWLSAGFRGGRFLVTIAPTARRVGNILVLDHSAPHAVVGGLSGGATLDKHGRLVGVVVASNRKTWATSADGKNLKSMLQLYGR